MLCVFQGPTPMNLIAGDVQSAVDAQVVACDRSPAVQERREGCFDFQMRPETLDEIHARLAFENGISVPMVAHFLSQNVGGFDPTLKQVVVRETRRPGPRKVRISPNLVKDDGSPVRLADFPDNWSFGNGVTCNVTVRLRDGSLRVISIVVFPDADEAAVLANYAALQQLLEG